MDKRKIFIYSDWHAGKSPQLMGELVAQFVRNKEIFSFEFNPDWLKSNQNRILDRDLHFFAGPQYNNKSKNNFGIFLDSAPDLWGQVLMRRREAINARKEGRKQKVLQASDYLLGVYDQTRMGAIRLKLEDCQDFVNNDAALAAPPWISLRELETACRKFEADEGSKSEHDKWLSMLIAPGSSLGGARPKASIIDAQGQLWIAKFPSKNDNCNIAAWEMVAHLMAKDIGLQVPECELENFSQYGSTFLSKRFDRVKSSRIHYASAMTLLGKNDGANSQDGSSYLDIANFIIQHGAKPTENLQELWQRIVFNIAIKNTDDHLRNHGFLLTAQGWILSPLFDVNPNPHGLGLSLNISESDNSLNFDLAMEVAPYFRLEKNTASALLQKVQQISSAYQSYASKLKIPSSQQKDMSSAFE